jgi:hypothetical protein
MNQLEKVLELITKGAKEATVGFVTLDLESVRRLMAVFRRELQGDKAGALVV